jgi:hypothetical protein
MQGTNGGESKLRNPESLRAQGALASRAFKQKAAVSDNGYNQTAGDTPAPNESLMHRKRLTIRADGRSACTRFRVRARDTEHNSRRIRPNRPKLTRGL